uniref:NADH dehydrogenase subunit 4L n=1 Tax=Ambigolimax valentianus TaxID=1338344 RepID=UPI002410C68A|nr:NADH dehydrogenase subunit 4L [Ambigolimax valentianus]WEI33077.1 NADH dehydrogenase subunit 4L [Ambigolimax valentianus]
MFLMMFLVTILFISFIISESHVIMLLLILEALMLILLTFLFLLLIEINMNPYMFLLILSFSACEAALGLSILVSLMRFHGNDYINSIVSNKWFAKIKYC